MARRRREPLLLLQMLMLLQHAPAVGGAVGRLGGGRRWRARRRREAAAASRLAARARAAPPRAVAAATGGGAGVAATPAGAAAGAAPPPRCGVGGAASGGGSGAAASRLRSRPRLFALARAHVEPRPRAAWALSGRRVRAPPADAVVSGVQADCCERRNNARLLHPERQDVNADVKHRFQKHISALFHPIIQNHSIALLRMCGTPCLAAPVRLVRGPRRRVVARSAPPPRARPVAARPAPRAAGRLSPRHAAPQARGCGLGRRACGGDGAAGDGAPHA